MAITIFEKRFTDHNGNNLTFYRSNVGDRMKLRLKISSIIDVISGSGNLLSLDPINNIITWSSGDFEAEGFRVGDSVTCVKYTSGGSLITTWNSVVQNVNGNQLDLTSIPTWIDATQGEIIRIAASRKRQGMILDFNLTNNGQTGSEFSLIDGEVTRCTFDLTQLNGSGTQIGTIVGHQSGQMVLQTSIQDITIQETGSNTSFTKWYYVTIDFINSGVYNQTPFNYANCLKPFVKMGWQSILGEPYDNYTLIFNDDADSGWFDEAFNNGMINATLVQGINEIAFDNVTDAQIVVEYNGSQPFGIGSCYVPDDETYYKNRSWSQTNLSMIVRTQSQPTSFPTTYQSPSNDVGAFYEIAITNVVQSGTTYTIDVKFSPTTAFTSFMDSRDDGDRLMRVWMRFGDVNLLVYNGQLESSPAIGGALKMVDHLFVDHSQNVQTFTGQIDGYEANIEDDLAFFGAFRVPFYSDLTSFSAQIIAKNLSTGESFMLQQSFFDIASIPNVNGQYILNEIQPVNSQLPTTSAKRECILALHPLIDDGNGYGVKIYFPFLYRWETWIDQPNANAVFYPNDQTKNWLPYGTFPDWSLVLRLELVRNGLLYEFENKIAIKDYDSDDQIVQDIQLMIESTGQFVNVVTENELMRVIATHELIDGNQYIPDHTWGMITIEPTESSPRWICSTIVPFDNNSLNPLEPFPSETTCKLTFPSPNIARMECLFDPTQIDLSNGVKFTTKIKFCQKQLVFSSKLKADGTPKQKTDGSLKFKS